MPGKVRHDERSAARLFLAGGLVISAGLVVAVGGRWGLAFAAGEVAMAAAAFLWPRSNAPLGGSVLLLTLLPLAAARHWMARLPGACACARLAKPPPGLVSVTGLAVALDVGLLGLVLWIASAQA